MNQKPAVSALRQAINASLSTLDERELYLFTAAVLFGIPVKDLASSTKLEHAELIACLKKLRQSLGAEGFPSDRILERLAKL